MSDPQWPVDPGQRPPLRVGGWTPPHDQPTTEIPPAPTGTPSPASPSRATGRRWGRGVATGVVAALVMAGVGFGAGRLTDDAAPELSSGQASQTTPASTTPAPLSGDEEEPVAAVAEALSPAVVQIESGRSLGSGFIYDREGLILTAAHVVDGADELQVRLADGTETDGEVLGTDPGTDVAVVKIDGSDDLPVAVLATGVDVEVGQLAVAIGSPFGLEQTVTSGIVSAIGRTVPVGEGAIPMIQTDAPINPGNSGGALADRRGRVIGINDQIVNRSQNASAGNVGVGFAIPIDTAKAVADQIVAGEEIETGFLGVSGADSTGERSGAVIVEVEPDSPAAEADLQRGDVITSVDGDPLDGMADLVAAIRSRQPGDTLILTVVRDDEERTVEVALGTAS